MSPTLRPSILAAAVLAAGLVVPGSASATAAPKPGCAAEQPTENVARAVAVECGERVEVLAGRDEFSQVFANPDGTSTMESAAAPVRVHRSDGSWTTIDPRLKPRADGSLAPAATLSDVSFSDGGYEPFITLKEGGSTLTMSWPGELPKPKVSGSSAVYEEVLTGVDLRVTATDTGFKHVLVVKNSTGAANKELRNIRLQVGGDVALKRTPDGRVRFANAADRTVAVAGVPSGWDSSYDASAAGEVLSAPAKASANSQRGFRTGAETPGVQAAEKVATPESAELKSNADEPGPGATTLELGLKTEGADHIVLTPDAALLDPAKVTFPVFLDPTIGPPMSKWAYEMNENRTWDLKGRARIGEDPEGGARFRSYFDFPTTSNKLTIKGKHIIAAKMTIWLDHSWSCTPTPAYLYRPTGGAITVGNGGRMKWGTRPLGSSAVYLGYDSANANEAGGCDKIQPDALMEFDNALLVNDIQRIANVKGAIYPVGLCACNPQNAYEGTTDRWKKFYLDNRIVLSVTYNTKPGVPAKLSPQLGTTACGGVVGTSSPTLQAQYADEDGSDTLTSTFQWQQINPAGAVTSVSGPSKPANNNGQVTLKLGDAADGKSYQFRVQTKDKYDYSNWSGWCTFSVDAFAPESPVVVSTPYEPCDLANAGECSAHGGPGVAGEFTFKPKTGTNSKDIVGYEYGWLGAATHMVTVAAGEPSPPLRLTPPRFGLNVLHVTAIDGAKKPSPTTSYRFLVNAPAAPVAHWPLDDLRDHGLTDQMGGAAFSATGSSWQSDVRFMGAKALTFDGTGAAVAAVPALDTSGSFGVAAWVRTPAACSGVQTAVSVDGTMTTETNHSSGFGLSFDCASRRWQMKLPATNTTSPVTLTAIAPAAAVVGSWTNLVGTWDSAENVLCLYVDGALAPSSQVAGDATFRAARATGWRATGQVVLGRERSNGADTGLFTSSVADVRLWNRTVTSDDIHGTAANDVDGVPAVEGILNPFAVGDWTFDADLDCACTSATQDAAYFARPMALDSGWSAIPPSAGYEGDDHDGNEALSLNGSTGYAGAVAALGTTADAAVAVLRTDQSFTVSAWVRPADFTASRTVLSQFGQKAGEFRLGYEKPENRWCLVVTTADVVGAAETKACGGTAPVVDDDYVHLVGVQDTARNELRLYVGGALVATKPLTAAPWQAAGGFVAGRSRITAKNGAVLANPFKGQIDAVQVWQGVLNDRQIDELS